MQLVVVNTIGLYLIYLAYSGEDCLQTGKSDE